MNSYFTIRGPIRFSGKILRFLIYTLFLLNKSRKIEDLHRYPDYETLKTLFSDPARHNGTKVVRNDVDKLN